MGSDPLVPTAFAPLRAEDLVRLLESGLELVCPSLCLHCGNRSGHPRGPWWPHLCRECAAALPAISGPVCLGGITVRARYLHAGPTRTLVHHLKYRGAVRVGVRLGQAMAGLVESTLEGAPPGTVVTGVPLHWRRRWVRGHDQVAALLRGLRRRIPWLHVRRALVRARATPSQVSLDAEARRRSPIGAFRLRPGIARQLTGRVVVLVDDVTTTGATLAAAARALQGAAPRRVSCLVAAISPRSVRNRHLGPDDGRPAILSG